MNYILFDDYRRDAFLPLSFTRTVADLLIGLYTNRERWEIHLDSVTSSVTIDSLRRKYPAIIEDDNILINGRLIPSDEVVGEIMKLRAGQKLISGEDVLAMKIDGERLRNVLGKAEKSESLSYVQVISKSDLSAIQSDFKVRMIENPWDFFALNAEVLTNDINLLDKGDFKNKSGEDNTYLGDNIFIHKDAEVNGAVLNPKNGPIVIDEGAEVMEGSLIRGPFYLGKHSALKMGSKIYGATSIGEHSKVGGEVNNSIVNSFSNKGHDGFLGNAVIGSWCNLGADTNNSNLKNDYSIVKLWNYEKQSFVRSGLQFLGLIMGDHSKCGINTMFNTGTVVGVCSNIYGSGFQPNFIPSFSWGKPGAYTTYQFEKAMQVAQRVMERRKLNLDGTEELLLKSVFEETEEMRKKFH